MKWVEVLINPNIISYITEQVLPQYDRFDPAHNRAHALKVIASSLDIARDHEVKLDMVYVVAAYHDLGLSVERKRHGEFSKQILAADAQLRRWFSEKEIAVMAQAAADHRASNAAPPDSIYGRIVAEADRDIKYTTILRRCAEYSLDNHPDYSDDRHWRRCVAHIEDKYGENGYLKLWLNTAENERGLAALRDALKDPDRMRADFDEVLREIGDRNGEVD